MENKAFTGQPLALLTKLAASAGALAGLLLMQAPPAADRVVVVLVPGVTQDMVTAAMAEGRAPHLASLVASGLAVEVDTKGPVSGLTFWRRTFASAGQKRSPLGVGGEEAPIWSDLGGRTAAVGVPDVLFPGFEGRRGEVAGGAAERGFVASSAAIFVAGDDLRAARLPRPFALLADKVGLAAAPLAPWQWSDWIETGEGGAERFQVLRAATDGYFLSPIYRTAGLPTIPPGQVVVSDPFLSTPEPAARAAFVEHLVAVDKTRGLAVERLLKSSGTPGALFYAFTVGSSVNRLFGGEGADSSTNARVIEVLDQRLGLVSAAAGERGLLVVVGGPGLDRETSTQAWCLVSSGEGERLDRVRMDVPGLARVLHYLLGVPLDAKDHEAIPSSLLARYPHRTSTAAGTVVGENMSHATPWSADLLESLLQRNRS